jgi:phosphoenolpyruvate synthase/pyruvate phosphate dikinase
VVIGGKAEGLAQLQALGLPVPPFVVVPAGEDVDSDEVAVASLGEPLAVRSSAVGEDAADRSAAGQYETVLHVQRDGLRDAVERVRASTDRAAAYGATGEVAVVVQRQIDATRAGVAFSRDPVDGRDVVLIECALGGGEAIVSGLVTPDRYWVDGEHVRARAAGAVRVLRDDEAHAIVALVRRAEEGFGTPVDVEFCFAGRELWLVQCRPITTLRERE